MPLIQSNLPANVTEESLGRFFAKCGPVGTIKIMWREYLTGVFLIDL